MRTKKLNILYEDKYLIIIDKPANLLTISTEKEKERTLFYKVFDYLKKKNKNNKVFAVNKLDKDASGIVVFAKDIKTKTYFQNNWDKFRKGFVTVVEGKISDNKGTLKNYLMETKTHFTYVVEDTGGKLAITEYEKILENKKYTMLSLTLKTGIKNQSRVQLSYIGNPIVGDKKYGSKKDPIRRMALVANYLSFNHPITKENIVIDIDIPNEIVKLVKNDVK